MNDVQTGTYIDCKKKK